MKKLNVTKEELISLGIDIAKEDGLSNITIRDFAKKADVSIGTVYHYFENKDNLLSEIIEGYWDKTINDEIENIVTNSTDFINSIEQIYSILFIKSSDFHKFLIRDLMSIKSKTTSCQMNYHLEELKDQINTLLENHNDILLKINSFSNKDKFLNYLVDNIFSSLRRKDKSLGFMKDSLTIIFNL